MSKQLREASPHAAQAEHWGRRGVVSTMWLSVPTTKAGGGPNRRDKNPVSSTVCLIYGVSTLCREVLVGFSYTAHDLF